MADATQAPPTTLADAIGGPLGMAETALPAVAFVVAYTATGSNTTVSAVVAVGLALGLTVARLERRQSPRHALSGLFGIALAAFIAAKSGKAENFFLPGLLQNAAYAAAFLISIAVRWPLVGVIVTKLEGEDSSWREDRVRVRAYRRATLLWAGMFSARLLVQLPLYLAGAVVALGVARTAMGIPLFALCLWLSWLLVRGTRAPPATWNSNIVKAPSVASASTRKRTSTPPSVMVSGVVIMRSPRSGRVKGLDEHYGLPSGGSSDFTTATGEPRLRTPARRAHAPAARCRPAADHRRAQCERVR